MRGRKPVSGHVHFSMVTLMENRQGINEVLKRAYATPALVPATPWLDGVAPAMPLVEGQVMVPGSSRLSMQLSAPGKAVWQYALWSRYGNDWRLKLVPADVRHARTQADIETATPAGPLTAMSISAVDRTGNESRSVTTFFAAGALR